MDGLRCLAQINDYSLADALTLLFVNAKNDRFFSAALSGDYLNRGRAEIKADHNPSFSRYFSELHTQSLSGKWMIFHMCTNPIGRPSPKSFFPNPPFPQSRLFGRAGTQEDEVCRAKAT